MSYLHCIFNDVVAMLSVLAAFATVMRLNERSREKRPDGFEVALAWFVFFALFAFAMQMSCPWGDMP